MPREFSDSGQFESSLTNDTVLAAFDEVDEAVVLTSDIVERVDRGRETVRQRLTELYEDGYIGRRKFGKQIVWWRVPPEDAETRPGRRLRRLSREINEPIVAGDIVYEDGRTRLLAGAQTEYVEQLSRERDAPIVVGEIVYEDGDIDLRAGVQSGAVASAVEEMMREEAESSSKSVIAEEEQEAIYRAALNRLAAADRLDERIVLNALNADSSEETGIDAETLLERLPEAKYEDVIREHFDELADQEALTMEALLAALDEEMSDDE